MCSALAHFHNVDSTAPIPAISFVDAPWDCLGLVARHGALYCMWKGLQIVFRLICKRLY